MTNDKLNPLFHENLYRPVYELNSAYWNFGAGAVTLASAFKHADAGMMASVALGLTGVLAFNGVRDVYTGIPYVKRQMKIFYNEITFEEADRLRKEHEANKHISSGGTYTPKEDRIYIGDGFEWGVEHANRAQQISGLTSKKEEIKLPLVIKPFKKNLENKTRALGGKPAIHGVGDEERQYIDTDTLFGHSMIMGNVGTGKTTLFILLSLAMIHKGYTVVVLDPKNDGAWRKALQKEMEYFGMGDRFHYFHPSQPSTSCRIDPVKNWNRPTEIAERISSIMVESGKEDSFVRFNWDVINKTVNAMLYAGIKPQIKTIARYATSEKNRLALACLKSHYSKTYGHDWAAKLDGQLDSYGSTLLAQLLGHYQEIVSLSNPNNSVEGIISLVMHNAEHMQKMTANLTPVFSVLTSSPMDELISPDEEIRHIDDEDLYQPHNTHHEQDDEPQKPEVAEKPKDIVDTADLVEGGGVLYMALDSLSDTKTAGYLSKLVLGDIAAVAGQRYNFSEGKGKRVAVFVDEVHAAIAGNEALLNLLAQGRAASMQMFIATQTKADLAAKTDSDTADRVLGLCNNFFSLRANDTSTQEYASKQFGEVPIASQQITLAQSSGNTDDVTDFGSGYSERYSKQNGPAFSETMLGNLPKLQYIARLSNGSTIKGRIPVVKQ